MESSFSNLSVTSPTSQLILQPFRRFAYVTAHSPTLPLLHLRHTSFSNPSFASPSSQALHLLHLARRPCRLPRISFSSFKCTLAFVPMLLFSHDSLLEEERRIKSNVRALRHVNSPTGVRTQYNIILQIFRTFYKIVYATRVKSDLILLAGLLHSAYGKQTYSQNKTLLLTLLLLRLLKSRRLNGDHKEHGRSDDQENMEKDNK